MSVAWNPARWWKCCMPKDGKKKKEIESFLIDQK